MYVYCVVCGALFCVWCAGRGVSLCCTLCDALCIWVGVVYSVLCVVHCVFFDTLCMWGCVALCMWGCVWCCV